MDWDIVINSFNNKEKPKEKDPLLCSYCNNVMDIHEGSLLCKLCGFKKIGVYDLEKSEKINFHESTFTPYKRLFHLNELLNQIQGKQRPRKKFHENIYKDIEKYIMDNNIDIKNVNGVYFKKILKLLGYGNYGRYHLYILNKVGGTTLNLTPHEENIIRQLFNEVERPYKKSNHKRKNIIPYYYILMKFFKIMKIEHKSVFLQVVKNKKKVKEYEDIWKYICEELKWDYF